MAKKKSKTNFTELKGVDKWSFAKVTTFFSAIMGLLAGFIVFPYLRVVSIGAQLIPGSASLITFLGFLEITETWLFAIPFVGAGIGALQGFVFGIVTAILYNLFARKFGGIKINI